MFSPDGKLLTFNDYMISNGHGLATMAFDVGSRKASGYRQIYQNSSSYPGWPFFLPDDKAVVFVLGDQADFSGNGLGLNVGGLAGSFGTADGDLYVVDLASGTTTMLAKAMGFASAQDIASNTTYLPFGGSNMSATAPATIADENDVPETTAYESSPAGSARSTPGAANVLERPVRCRRGGQWAPRFKPAAPVPPQARIGVAVDHVARRSCRGR
ncbi:MAG TPA: hypothetical protein VKU41_19265 [Polyangiaceae bacterium]|nr:hypothetical protein [Polyangiaceae bacterium]